jgi:hypothetical protein
MPKSPLTLSFHRTFAALAAAARTEPRKASKTAPATGQRS